MYKLLNEGRQEVAKRKLGGLRNWANDKRLLKDIYDDTFTLDVKTCKSGTRTIQLLDSNKSIYPVMSLLKDEALDRPYIISLKNILKDMKSIFKKK